jgi:hypothetical protein
MTDETPPPVLYLTQVATITWEQHAPGGCRCVCRLYHDGDQGTCLESAEPGRLLRVVTQASAWGPADITDPLQICAACYTAIAPRASTHASADDEC